MPRPPRQPSPAPVAAAETRVDAPAPAAPTAAGSSSSSSSDPLQDDTARRLIQSGAAEFARRGFHEARVRRICTGAGANISAIRYHFGSKEGLYRAVVDVGRGQMCGGSALPLMQDDDDPVEALEVWVRWFLRMLLVQQSNHPWIGDILAHEMVRPTACLDEFVKHTAGPVRMELVRIARRLLPPDIPEPELQQLVNATVGMCASHRHSRQMLTRLGFPPPQAPDDVDALARVLTKYALSGLTGYLPAPPRPASTSPPPGTAKPRKRNGQPPRRRPNPATD